MHGHEHSPISTATPKMFITQEEMNKAQIPLCYRDYCAHLLPKLNKCRHETWYMPWACKFERIAWQKCQHDDYVRRMEKQVQVNDAKQQVKLQKIKD